MQKIEADFLVDSRLCSKPELAVETRDQSMVRERYSVVPSEEPCPRAPLRAATLTSFLYSSANMRERYGSPDRPIWLIGDSNPDCADVLAHPLDPCHPSRHNIWTPVLDVIQERVFPRRLRAFGYKEDDALYIRNAVIDPADRADPARIAAQIASLRQEYAQHQPLLVLSFGAFAFALCRNAFETEHTDAAAVIRTVPTLTVRALARQFEQRASNRDCRLLPLLHQIVARSFAHVHEEFKGSGASNYFDYTGTAIAQRLLTYDTAPIWKVSTLERLTKPLDVPPTDE